MNITGSLIRLTRPFFEKKFGSFVTVLSSRGVSFMIPSLHPLEQQYVSTQSQLILKHEYKSKLKERENIFEITGFNSSSRHLSDELFVKRLALLLEQVEIKDKKERKRLFKYIDEQSSKINVNNFHNSIFSYKSSRLLQDISTKLLLSKMGQVPKLKEDKIYESFPQQTLEKYPVIQRFFDAKFNKKRTEVCRNIVRNIYILVQLLQVDLTDHIEALEIILQSQQRAKDHQNYSSFLMPNALEVLIQLNVYDNMFPLDASYDQCSKQINICQGVINGFFLGQGIQKEFVPNNHISRNESHVNDFSLSYFYIKLMRNVGFEDWAIRHVMNIRSGTMIKLLSRISHSIEKEFENDFVVASKTLSSRLIKLNEECTNQCITLASYEKFLIVTHWYLISGDEQIPEDVNFYQLLEVINETVLGSKKDTKSSAYRKIEDVLGEKSWSLFLHALDYKRILTPYWCHRNLSLLQSQAFTDQQIRDGSQILLYDPALIETFISSIDENTQYYEAFASSSSWRKDAMALRKMCYYMERSLGFSDSKKMQAVGQNHKVLVGEYPLDCKQIVKNYLEEVDRLKAEESC